MGLEIENTEADKTQRTYARLAGLLFLWEIVIALGSGFIISHIAGSGTFAETAQRIAASERLYRMAFATAVIVSISSAVLAYVTLVPFRWSSSDLSGEILVLGGFAFAVLSNFAFLVASIRYGRAIHPRLHLAGFFLGIAAYGALIFVYMRFFD